ncbi:MAG: hypothetical protein LBK60_04180 [Verrucomicrobiales bacterium]|jgi:hypothetical protein|nr:hypothetical protein [Verrucomicrobiales bacterium]
MQTKIIMNKINNLAALIVSGWFINTPLTVTAADPNQVTYLPRHSATATISDETITTTASSTGGIVIWHQKPSGTLYASNVGAISHGHDALAIVVEAQKAEFSGTNISATTTGSNTHGIFVGGTALFVVNELGVETEGRNSVGVIVNGGAVFSGTHVSITTSGAAGISGGDIILATIDTLPIAGIEGDDGSIGSIGVMVDG